MFNSRKHNPAGNAYSGAITGILAFASAFEYEFSPQ